MSKILIIEDEEPIRRVLVRILTEEDSKFEIHEASDGKKGLDSISKESFDLVLCDIKMPKIDGMELLQRARKQNPSLPFIMLTGHGNIETAVESMKLGAYDFIPKPPDLNRLITSVRNALEKKELVTENKILRKKVAKKYQIIGESKSIKTVHELIDKVAQSEARVLITGESGTGKELVAHQIHEQSLRKESSFIEVNCAAIPAELIESELFGHIKGSFTSAVKDRQGKFEAANAGTLFLDEIADMSLAAQAKVLRALEENKVQRVGSEKDITVDVRVIAATNKDLKKEIEKGNFREDLYHR
ncbi:MAG TPA: sigma-54 dependent transcriptional regulator, partial [Flavobacteriaceae bacterium]|nr:sigma-54 dependent transcriptional regulator [Flavobacteriaceae bacterium]